MRTASRMIERIVGRFGGFDLGIPGGPWRRDTRPVPGGTLPVQRRTLSNGSGPGGALLGALESVGKHHADAEIQLETRRKRLEDLRLELARSFEHEGRLTDLLVRQRELLKRSSRPGQGRSR